MASDVQDVKIEALLPARKCLLMQPAFTPVCPQPKPRRKVYVDPVEMAKYIEAISLSIGYSAPPAIAHPFFIIDLRAFV